MLNSILIQALHINQVATSQHELAYSARYYFEGSRRSFYQIYLVRHDGKRRKQITHGSNDCFDVSFTDRHTLRWREERSPSDQYWSLNLRTGKKTQTKPFPSSRDFDYRYMFSEKEKCYTHKLNSGNRLFEFRWMNHVGDMTGQTFNVRIASGGEERTLKLSGSQLQNVIPINNSTILIHTDWAFNRFENYDTVYRYDWTKNELKTLISNVGFLNFEPSRKYWFDRGHESRPRSNLKDGRVVWTSPLRIGDWYTGKRWDIASGLVHVWNADFRPNQ